MTARTPAPAVLLLLALTSAAALAANDPAPTPNDYRAALLLTLEAGKPVQTVTLPDAVYAGLVDPGMADVQVFNGADVAVPFARCPADVPEQTTEQQALPIFPLHGGAAHEAGGRTQIHVDPDASVDVHVEPGSTAAVAERDAGVILDARKRKGPVRALRFDWSTADGASSLRVRVEASDDLNDWDVLVPDTALVRTTAGSDAPERSVIALPDSDSDYLRVTRADSGPAPTLRGVTAEVLMQADKPALMWVDTVALPTADDGSFVYDAGRHAPMSQARIALPAANMRLRVRLESRSQPSESWRYHWEGEVYDLDTAKGREHSADAALPATTADRYWHLIIADGAESLGTQAPRLSLAYAPARLQFMAQGEGPFRLAFGSGHATGSPAAACNALAGNLEGRDRKTLIGTARPGELVTLGGDAALLKRTEAPKRQPYLLWGILIVGVGVLVMMSLSVLRSAGKKDDDSRPASRE